MNQTMNWLEGVTEARRLLGDVRIAVSHNRFAWEKLLHADLYLAKEQSEGYQAYFAEERLSWTEVTA